MNPADFERALTAAGVSPADVNGIKTILNDPHNWSGGTLTPSAIDQIKNNYHVNIHGNLIPGSVSHRTDYLHGAMGAKMNQVDLLTELNSRGITNAAGAPLTATDLFDTSGHLTPAGVALLTSKHVNVSEILSSIPGGGGAPAVTPGSGWSTLRSIHFNDNAPHGPGHVLDELKFWWKGAPEMGVDGNYHFTVKGMFDPHVAHSNLPPGVTMPADASGLKVGLQINQGGHNYWKFFPIDRNGDIALPPEYFDRASVGVVPRMGDSLPGLKTNALAVGFDDSHGSFQVLSSVKGQGGFTPPSQVIEYVGDITFDEKGQDKFAFDALWDKAEEGTRLMVPPPIIGAPMAHLEYGQKKGAPGAPRSSRRQRIAPRRGARATPRLAGPRPGVSPAPRPGVRPAPGPAPAPAPRPLPGPRPVPAPAPLPPKPAPPRLPPAAPPATGGPVPPAPPAAPGGGPAPGPGGAFVP
jgi:hypothetical protein